MMAIEDKAPVFNFYAPPAKRPATAATTSWMRRALCGEVMGSLLEDASDEIEIFDLEKGADEIEKTADGASKVAAEMVGVLNIAREQLAEQVVEGLKWLVSAREIITKLYDSAVAKLTKPSLSLPASLKTSKSKPVPSQVTLRNDTSSFLTAVLRGAFIQWEADVIKEMEKSAQNAAEDLTEFAALVISPLAHELRELLLKQAQSYIAQTTEKISVHVHKALSDARKKSTRGDDSNETDFMLPVSEKAVSTIVLVRDELASLLDKLQNDLNHKLDSTIAGRFVRLSSKLFNEVFDGEETLSQLGHKANTFEKELKTKCKLLQHE
jgi:hypothetical protein